MRARRFSQTIREIALALRYLNRYEPPQLEATQLSRSEAARRFKQELLLRYGTPNRCC